MADGIHALEGFDYQATVILELMLQHFQAHPEGQLRPEGADDVVLRWEGEGGEQSVFVQVKKAKVSSSGEPTEEDWQLAAIARDLMSGSLRRLRQQSGRQVWVLGDEVEPRVRTLLAAGVDARNHERSSYLLLLHLLAKNAAAVTAKLSRSAVMKLARWSLPPASGGSFEEDLRALGHEFEQRLERAGVEEAKRAAYRQALHEQDEGLPELLARIEIRDKYGTEAAVRGRVAMLLQTQYKLASTVIDHTLLRNLRGFINDIAKQRERWVTREELELELISVWPEMTPLRIPPPFEPGYVRRPAVIQELLGAIAGRGMVDCLGVSGSGKTSIATELGLKVEEPCLYVEVRQQTRFRSVLAGVAYGLRRYAEFEPFRQVTLPGLTEEEILGRCAKAFSAVARTTLVVVDLVEGECNDTFARDLGRFARQIAPGNVRWIFFSQQSPLRELGLFEQHQLDVRSYNLPGLSFEELAELSTALGRDFAREHLWQVFVQLTAGRQSGLIPALARVLLRSVDATQLMEVAQLPAEQIVSAVEQRRFDTLPPHLRSAALRLVCLVLPFTLAEAEELFPQESIRAVIPTLLSLGLLRPLGDGQLEMHETIRRGMERLLPPVFKQETHTLLAAWYARRDALPAHIFHLEQAGRTAEAREKAVAAFRNGRNRAALLDYLRVHNLLPVEDIAAWLEAGLSSDDYLLVQALASVAQPSVGRRLLSWVTAHPEQFDADYHWAWAISEAIISSDPALVRELAEFALERFAGERKEDSRLERVRFAAARRLVAPADAALLPLFDAHSEAEKRALVPLLLTYPGRAALLRVLAYMAEHRWPLQGHQRPGSGAVKLELRTTAQVEDFLAALPRQRVGQMLVHRSALLEPFEEYIWSTRRVLQPVARQVIARDEQEVALLENAIRVSIHLADEEVIAQTERLREQPGPVQPLALAVPVLLDEPGWLARYEALLLDPQQSLGSRHAVLPLLALLGANLDQQLQQVLASAPPEQTADWEVAFLQQLPLRPFASAVGLVRKRWRADEPLAQALAGFALPHLNRLPGTDVTDLLIEVLQSPKPVLRRLASIALTKRRSRRALGALVASVKQSSELAVQLQAVVAVLASGPRSADDVRAIPEQPLTVGIWRTVAIGRLRLAEQGHWLVQLALDRMLPWQVRRTAVFAASHLPFEAALQSIAPAILAERAPLPIDNAWALGHRLLAVIATPDEHEAIHVRLLRGQASFVASLGAIYDDLAKGEFKAAPFLSGAQAVTWLWERLEHLRWREDASALRKVHDELHVPLLHAAVLRGLRLAGRPEDLEHVLSHAATEWVAARALLERLKLRPLQADLDRLKQLVSAGPFAGSHNLQNQLSEIVPKDSPARPVSLPPVPSKSTGSRLTLDRIRDVLRTPGSSLPPDASAEIASEEELNWLMQELDPRNDHTSITQKEGAIRLALTGTGFALSPSGRNRWIDNQSDARSKLRPIVSAANRFGLEIPWHAPLIAGEVYQKRFLYALAAYGDSDRIFLVLKQHQDLILPSLDGVLAGKLSILVDERILPFVSRFLNAGPPRVLEALCLLVARILDDRVTPILARLLERWVTTTRLLESNPSQDDSVALSRALHALSRHARFEEIPNWDDQLLSLLTPRMEFSRRLELVRIVRRSPNAYAYLEALLQRTKPFVHFWEDEVDLLDRAADDLFARVKEE